MKKKVILYGYGNRCKDAIVGLDYEYDIICILDKDCKKKGKINFKTYNGCDKFLDVISLDEIDEIYKKNDIIITIQDSAGVIKKLLENSWSGEIDTLNGLYDMDKYTHRRKLKEYIENNNMVDSDKIVKDIYNLWNNHYITPYIIAVSNKYEISKNSKILDYGFGCGTLFLHLKTKGYEDVYGIDIDKEKYEFCKLKICECGYPQEWKECLSIYDGKHLPYETESFDYIFCDQIIEHLYDVKECLTEVLRVLKSGGTLHIMCPNYEGSYEPHYYIDLGNEISICDNTDILKKRIIDKNLDIRLFNELNFITPSKLINIIKDINESVSVADESSEQMINLYVKK